MGEWLERFFKLRELGTTCQREMIGGFTTFATMSYIIAVNPAVLSAAGIPPGPSMVATVLTAVFGTLVMGLYANRPFAVAPYMGENAFIAYTVVRMLGYRWQTALGAVVLAGVLFCILTVARVRQWLVEAIPSGLRYSFAAGIGLFVAFAGLNEMGIVTAGAAGAPVRIGQLRSPAAMLSVGCFLLISILTLWRVPGAILLGIVAGTLAAYGLGVAHPPRLWFGLPPDPRPILLSADLRGALSWGFFGILLTIFVMALIDTLGTLVGVSERAGLLDERGHLPQIERAMLADALATTFAGLVGTTTAGAYVESAAGVGAGARSGLSSVVVASLFSASLFCAPFVTSIPASAYGPALALVGMLMVAPVVRIDFADFTESVPALTVIALMSFTYNIAIGITAGFVLYPAFKFAAGRYREVRPGLWALGSLSALFFIFYPYR